ncbi:hypothetical protein [Acetobacter conturbans]|uniref:Abortive infection protein-like C-terminal domain-containing protein n=1 Tax=Acetobacter conturbans TaxID=1737472 RepID=A0ABX0K3Z6_9PROT|nr:hypothetical protein [Acetobacter conturbans]NHN89985.1 hypothetical protein [Acetobacter conturbans]
MGEFNPMTIVAAAEVISDTHSHSDINVWEVQWAISDRGGGSSKSARVSSLAKAALSGGPPVHTEAGLVTLERALVETALSYSSRVQNETSWRRLKAGLRQDGFEVLERPMDENHSGWALQTKQPDVTLIRMLPSDVPGLDMREAESEVVQLLRKHGLVVADGHLSRAISAFQRGEWSGANGELRNFLESYLNEIAIKFGCDQMADSRQKRDFLGSVVKPPFLLTEYNEWNAGGQKTPFVQALLSRLHPHGGHPGLSEEEDATFRLQINLVTARLFLRRLDRGSY